MLEKIKSAFNKHFSGIPAVYCSPGRVNLIGEHTDYNNGFVLPASIDKAIYAAIRPNESCTVNLWSTDYNAAVSFEIDGPKPEQLWASFVYGVVKEMEKLGIHMGGFDAAFGGNVPLGAGLSSSAALESVFGFALNEIFHGGLTREQLAKVGQMTEHNYIGVMCGIMDQFASLLGRKGNLLKLDCRSLEYELVPFKIDGHRVVLVDSMVKHSLASSEYNVRRRQAEAGVAVVSRYEPGIESLRDVTFDMLEKYGQLMQPISLRRCEFVLNENKRVLDACDALRRGDLVAFGRLMNGSHERLSQEYEVSCEELDFIAGFGQAFHGVLGARMMGGGFGGCVIHLMREDIHDEYIAALTAAFQAKYGMEPRVIDVVIGDGARRLE